MYMFTTKCIRIYTYFWLTFRVIKIKYTWEHYIRILYIVNGFISRKASTKTNPMDFIILSYRYKHLHTYIILYIYIISF